MQDQVIMSPNNGQLAVAIPLYRLCYDDMLMKTETNFVMLTGSKPIAYAVDCGELGIQLMNAEFVESKLEFLGDL